MDELKKRGQPTNPVCQRIDVPARADIHLIANHLRNCGYAVTTQIMEDGRTVIRYRDEKLCPICNSRFIPSRSDQIFCSSKCRNKRMMQNADYAEYRRAYKTEYARLTRNKAISRTGRTHAIRTWAEKYKEEHTNE